MTGQAKDTIQVLDSREYWIKKLSGEINKTIIPYDRNTKKRNFNEISFVISPTVTELLDQLSKKSELKTFIVLATSVLVTLNKLTGEDDQIIGIPIFRQDESVMLQNTLLLIRNTIDGKITFLETVKIVSNEILHSSKNYHYSIDNLLHTNGLIHEVDEDFPFFDISVSLENIHDLRYLENYKHNFGFIFNIIEGKIHCKIKYNISYYYEETVQNIRNLFLNVLKSALENHNEPIFKIKGTSEEEDSTILSQFNAKINHFDQNDSIISLFERQVQNSPNQIASICQDEKFTYAELSDRVTNLAYNLIERYKVINDSRIGVILHRSSQLMVAILGILKAGASFVPIDPNTPKQRIDQIFADSEVELVISNLLHENLLNGKIQLVDPEDCIQSPIDYAFPDLVGKRTAYVLYTSGTMGKPKGVMVPHMAVVNRMYWMKMNFHLTTSDVILQKTSISFDVSICELFRWIYSGSRICFVNDKTKKDIGLLVDFIQEYHITTIDFTPNELDVFLDYIETTREYDKLKSLRWVFIGAEVVGPNLVTRFNDTLSYAFGTQLINEYGPTEATVDVTFYNCSKDYTNQPNVPIGKPIANNHLYIIDKYLNLLPIGVAGEVCISGRNLAKGYLGDLALTNEKFVKNPFVEGEMLYKTGDIAVWLPDGNIDFRGRRDKQIKINGHRIEIHDIENKILLYDKVGKVHIEFINSEKDQKNTTKELCAYIVPKHNKHIDIIELKKMLKLYFPEYIIPCYFIELKEFPLKESGKIDKDALPLPEDKSDNVILPKSKSEFMLRDIWSEVLKKDRNGICIEDNFFDIGGNSLSVNLMSSKILQKFSKKVSLVQIFQHPTIKEIATLLDLQDKKTKKIMKAIKPQKDYEISSGQLRLFYLQELDTDSMAYNLPFIVEIKNEPNLKQIDAILNQLIQRHEELRISFEYKDGTVKQMINSNIVIKAEFVDLKDEIEDIDKKIQSLLKPFQLNRAPLMRVLVIRIPSLKFLLLTDMHHIIADGLSHSFIINDFVNLYNGRKLPELKYQYKDYVNWEFEALNSGELENQKEFWMECFKTEYIPLDLPTDFSRPKIRSFNGESISIQFTNDEIHGIKTYLSKKKITLFMYFVSVYYVFLNKITLQEDICIGTPIDTRDYLLFDGVVGNFTNMLAMRNEIDVNDSVYHLLEKIKKNIISYIENKEYPFELLIKDLDVLTDSSRNPLVDVAINVIEFETTKGYEDSFANSPIEIKNDSSKYDLFFRVFKIDNRLDISLEYSKDIYKRETIENYLNAIKELIFTFINNDKISIKDIKIHSLQCVHDSPSFNDVSFNL